jgi:DMSO/TMAO reductase YedYZ molybdopterin-dependent catalytic subunit
MIHSNRKRNRVKNTENLAEELLLEDVHLSLLRKEEEEEQMDDFSFWSTPTALAGTQVINRDTYTLIVDGLVNKTLTLTYSDLQAYPQVSTAVWMPCA